MKWDGANKIKDMNKGQISKQINRIKALAIISVICAHCNIVGDTAAYANQCVHFLLNALGTIGVGVFFVVAGWSFMKYTDKSAGLKILLGKKVKRLLLPWLICGTAVYLYVVLRKGGMSLLTWIEFLLGKGSYLYFVPVLFILYVIGYFIYQSNAILYCGMLLSLTSNVLTYMGLMDGTYANVNFMNWLVYFSLGIYLAKVEIKRNSVMEYICVLLTLISIVVASIKNFNLTYWTTGFLVFEAFAAVTVMVLAEGIAAKCEKIANRMEEIGKASMAIYLLHMPVAGIVANICGRVDVWLLTLIRPVIVLFITVFALEIYRRIVNGLNKKWLLYIVGLSYERGDKT